MGTCGVSGGENKRRKKNQSNTTKIGQWPENAVLAPTLGGMLVGWRKDTTGELMKGSHVGYRDDMRGN